MIRYKKGAWETLFYWWGGINRHLMFPSAFYLLFLCLLYYVQRRYDSMRIETSTSGLSMLGSLTVFLLVFRMNQSMLRNNEAEERTDAMFGEMDYLAHSVCHFMAGAREDHLHDLLLHPNVQFTEEEIKMLRLHGELASIVRVHVVRLTVAFGVSCLLYFRLLTALAEVQGELEEEDLVQIIFLHGRLQSLLYEEEMEIIDRYMCISRESDKQGEAEYRAEVNRFRIARQRAGLLIRPRVAGDLSEEGCQFVPQVSDIVPPLPKVVLSMLMEACHLPMGQKWGYHERVLTIISSICADALDQMTHLSSLIFRPVSLAYYQHCRVIVVIFSFMWPLVTALGEDNLGSVFDNIVFPFVVYWAMSGLERLAEMMENPVGDDDTDINLYQQLHQLEVGAQASFELAEVKRSALRRLFARISVSRPDVSQESKKRVQISQPFHFEDYFCWLPIPTKIAEGMVMKHGHVDHAHMAFFEGHIAKFRSFLRRALKRHTLGRKSPYEAIPQDADPDELNVYPEAPPESTMGVIQRDSNGFWHYLAFRPVMTANTSEVLRQELCRKRLVNLLGAEHSAVELLASESTDTGRSVMLRPLVPPRPRKYLLPEALMRASAKSETQDGSPNRRSAASGRGSEMPYQLAGNPVYGGGGTPTIPYFNTEAGQSSSKLQAYSRH